MIMAEGKPKRSAYMPVLGLIIAVVLGIVAWAVAPSVIDVLAAALPFFRGTELPLSTTRPLFTGIIVLLGLVIFGLIAALVMPKDAQQGSEREVERERDALRRRQQAARAEARKSKGRR
jgi:hypothetical protein